MNSLVKLFCCLGSTAALAVSATKQPTSPTASGDVKTTSFPFRCQLAAFGAYLPEEGASGEVVLAPDRVVHDRDVGGLGVVSVYGGEGVTRGSENPQSSITGFGSDGGADGGGERGGQAAMVSMSALDEFHEWRGSSTVWLGSGKWKFVGIERETM
ncbi:hypothetical protein PHYPSEUDO_004237 [Phytophthora pseudosyringae]|uniref:Uncharacterized protein n=1 Tax=Phytophthora pseudosyringae TaxID=221518 RepID=A0A8T1VP68_9STRA|nr:hypothetical protein PHYPSEUDO_004237 [Phytophthora pseudosyringae]